VTELLTIDDFTPHVGKLARFRGTGFAFSIDHIIGETGAPPPSGWTRAPFVVIFRGPKTPVMPEGLYECEIDGGPTHALYVAPVDTRLPDYQDYQAAFN
jgi:hypothetical protein